MGFTDKLKHAWTAFTDGADDPIHSYGSYGANWGTRPDKTRMLANDRSVLTSMLNRIAIDVAALEVEHVRLDSNRRYTDTLTTGLNTCLTLEANTDQAARAFRQDCAMSLFEKGTIAIVPVETSLSPSLSTGYDIKSLRVGEIVAWYPQHVRVLLYNEKVGRKEEITLPKAMVAIVENPLYSVMNEPNSTTQRLIRKLSLLDSIDEQVGSGKLDLIIQLPYVIKSEARRQQAEQRRGDIETQLKGSKYGIAYTDGTERITQLNRPAENNMLAQVEYLTKLLYGQLGLTEAVFNGTASETEMLNYHNRTVEPVLTSILEAMKRTFLTKTARSQGQSIEFYRDPFKLVAVSSMADIADKFIRNQIMTSNDVRAGMGLRPSADPKADMLNNPNMPNQDQAPVPTDLVQPPATP